MKYDAGLEADGFDRIAVLGVGLPHFIWKIDIELEFDRDLRLSEETLLRLLAAGVGDPDRLARLLGVHDSSVVSATIVELLRKGLVSPERTALVLTDPGRQALQRALTRETRRFDSVEVRHDPYRNVLLWRFDELEFKSARQLRQAGLQALPAVGELQPLELELRYREIQSLIERDGLPFSDASAELARRRPEVVRVTALKNYVAYLQAELEVWHKPQRKEWQWRLLRGGGEEKAASNRLADLEKTGAVVIPLEDAPTPIGTASGEAVHEAALAAQTSVDARLLQTGEHRDALREAILTAQESLLVISPWVRTSAVDDELLCWLQSALQRQGSLEVLIGYGIERTPSGLKPYVVRDQEEALLRLRRLGERSHGRLRVIEVGNTHEKVVVCDNRYVIISSFNFLSFNPKPGKGIRRELGYRITERTVIEQVRKRVLDALLHAEACEVKRHI